MKRVNLVNAAKEFNQVIKLDEQIEIKGNDNLAKDLFSVLNLIEKGDNFSEKSLKVFKQLKKQFSETVEVGTTVELDTNTNKIQKVEKMSKKEKGTKSTKENEKMGNNNAEVIAAILNPSVKKEELVELIEGQKVFKKVKSDLLEVKNFMSLKKQMLEVFDAAEVQAVKDVMPKPERTPREPKAPKVDPIVEQINDVEDVDELKAIAKADDRFNWKELKGLGKMKKIVKAMLEIVESSAPKAKAKKEPAAPKVVANPLIAEIEGAEDVNALKAIAKANDQFNWKELKALGKVKKIRKAMLSDLPAEVEQKSSRKSSGDNTKPGVVNTIVECLQNSGKGGISKDEIHKVLVKKFPERSPDSMKNTINTQIPGMLKVRKNIEVVRKGENWKIKS